MNNSRAGAVAIGALLVAFGVLFLLQNFGLFGSVQNVIWLCLSHTKAQVPAIMT